MAANVPIDAKTKKRILSEYRKGATPKDLSTKYDVSVNTIKSWIKREKVKVQVGAEDAPAKKQVGAPEGNVNAVGSGAPEGNTNALKHGGYAAIKHDTCDEVEREMMDDMPIDTELLLLDQIREYAVRERRLQHLIQACKTGTLEIKEQWEENTALSKLAGEEGKGIKQLKESGYARRERLEQELTSVQRAKNKAIDSLTKLRLAGKDLPGEDDEENNLFQQIAQSMKAVLSNEV